MNVKTPYGPRKDYKLLKRTMQGDTWACALASAQVHSFGKKMLIEEPHFMFQYKSLVPIPFLGQVDDLIGVADDGYKTKQLNLFVNVKTADNLLVWAREVQNNGCFKETSCKLSKSKNRS